MSRGAQKQVNPKVATGVIVVVLGVVQYFWWKGLLAKPKPVTTARRSGGPLGQAPPSVVGNTEVHVDTLAGAPAPGYKDGPGHAARFDAPTGIALDPQGNVIVADTRNHRIRHITLTGIVTTVAGGAAGSADGPVAQAQFNQPCGVAVAADGTIYVADTGNHRIRKIKDGQVTTLAGSAAGLAEGVGGAAKFQYPTGLTLDTQGNLLVADTGNRRVRIVTPAGAVRTGWTTPGTVVAVASGPQGGVAAGTGGLTFAQGAALRPIPLETFEDRTNNMTLSNPTGVCWAPQGWFITDGTHCGVFLLNNGEAVLLAGFCQPSGPAPNWLDNTGNRARFGRASGVVSDGKGTAFICDTSNNAIRRLTLPGIGNEEGRGAPP